MNADGRNLVELTPPEFVCEMDPHSRRTGRALSSTASTVLTKHSGLWT